MKSKQHKYAPSHTFALGYGRVPILRYVAHPPGHYGMPIRSDMTCLELVTAHGSRYWGFDRCYINARLRMVCVGFSTRNEIVRGWATVSVKDRVHDVSASPAVSP